MEGEVENDTKLVDIFQSLLSCIFLAKKGWLLGWVGFLMSTI